MGDIPYINKASEIKITGQDSTGDTVNYVSADASGRLASIITDNISLSNNITASSQTVTISTAGMGAVIVEVHGTFSGTLSFQASLDGTTYFYWGGLSNNTLGNIGSITSPDQVTFNAAGIQSFQIISSSWVSGTAVVSAVASQSTSGLVSPNTGTSNSGGAFFVEVTNTPLSIRALSRTSDSIATYQANNTNSPNSSTTNLASGASFTGSPSSTTADGYQGIAVELFADQNCTIQVEQSPDAGPTVTHWDITDSWTTTASVGDARVVAVVGQWYRIVVTNNGASTTTSFRLITSTNQTTPVLPRALTQAGNLKIAIEEAIPVGANVIGGVNQGSANTLSNKWPVQVTDGTNTLPTMDTVGRAGFQKITDGTNTQAVKAASTAAATTDPSAVVAFSPNSPLPSGTNSIGAVTQTTAANLNATVVQATPANLQVTATPITLTKGTQGSDGFTVQNLKDAGRVYKIFYVDQIAGVITTEALVTMNINSGGTVTTGTSYTVTTGKTLRLQSFSVSIEDSTTTAVSGRVRVRSAATVAATSGIIFNADMPKVLGTAAAGAGSIISQTVPDGIEIAAGQEIGISQLASSASSTVSCCLIGYEY